MRKLAILSCVALFGAAAVSPALGAEAKAGKPRPKTAKAAEAPALSREDLLAPYSSLLRQMAGPHSADGRGAGRDGMSEGFQSNATSWKMDLTLTPRRGQDDSPVQFRLGRDSVVDPLTKKELTPRADPLGARKSLEEFDLKGAADKLGGKAEIQVDVLKF